MAFKRMLSENAQAHPWDPSQGPADFFSDTVLFWEWNRHHHWIRLPRFSALSYLTIINWAILRKVTFLGYPQDPSWGLEDIILDTVAIWQWYSWGHSIQQPCFRPLSYLKLQFWSKGTKVVGLPICIAQLLPMGLSIFTQHAFKGHRRDRSWIQRRLRNWGAFLKKICKIQTKSLLPASFPGKKVRWVGPGKRPSEGGKWCLVKRA